jgi:hypothetical protein
MNVYFVFSVCIHALLAFLESSISEIGSAKLRSDESKLFIMPLTSAGINMIDRSTKIEQSQIFSDDKSASRPHGSALYEQIAKYAPEYCQIAMKSGRFTAIFRTRATNAPH